MGTGVPIVTAGLTFTTRIPESVWIVAVTESRRIGDAASVLFETFRTTAKNWCSTPKLVGMMTAAGIDGRRFGLFGGSGDSWSGDVSPLRSSSSMNVPTEGGWKRGGGPSGF